MQEGDYDAHLSVHEGSLHMRGGAGRRGGWRKEQWSTCRQDGEGDINGPGKSIFMLSFTLYYSCCAVLFISYVKVRGQGMLWGCVWAVIGRQLGLYDERVRRSRVRRGREASAGWPHGHLTSVRYTKSYGSHLADLFPTQLTRQSWTRKISR